MTLMSFQLKLPGILLVNDVLEDSDPGITIYDNINDIIPIITNPIKQTPHIAPNVGRMSSHLIFSNILASKKKITQFERSSVLQERIIKK